MKDRRLIVWWRGRTLREQRLLLAMAAVLALMLAWLLVVRPLGDALAESKERHGVAVLALAEARGDAAAIRAAEQGGPPLPGGPLDALIGQAAAEAGFPVTRIERQGTNQVALVIESVRPQAFFGWLARQESTRGIIVERLSATPNTDQTLAIQVTLRGRGS